MAKNLLNPTAHQTFRIDYVEQKKGNDINFADSLTLSRQAEA